MDIGTAENQVVLHQFMVELHSRMVRLRNRMSYGSKFSKVWASMRALIVSLFHPSLLQIDLTVNREILGRGSVSASSVTNDLFSARHIPYTDNRDGGVLGVNFSVPMNPLFASSQVLDTFLGTADFNAHVHMTRAKR